MEWIRTSSVFKALEEHIRDISKMSVASWMATSLDFVVFTILHRLFSLPIPTSTALGSLAGAMLHFTVSRFWVFRTMKHSFAEAVWRYIIVVGGALVLHSTATTLLAKYLIPLEELAWLISKNTVFLCWVYPGTKYHVFGKRNRSKRDRDAQPSHRDRQDSTRKP
jgi:putative flippase GtrA